MNEFSTKDLHFAAYLKLKGLELLRVERRDHHNKRPIYFIFSDEQTGRYLEDLYWNKGDMVNILEYVPLIRELRDRTATANYV